MTAAPTQIPEDTSRDLEVFFSDAAMDKEAKAIFIDRALRSAMFFQAVERIREANRGRDPEELQAAIDLAVAETRREIPLHCR